MLRTKFQAPRFGLLFILFALCTNAQSQQNDRPLGLAFQVYTDGFFSNTVAKVAVHEVTSKSIAEDAGVSVGDELVMVQGVPVPGTKGSILKAQMEFVPGESKRLVFKRAIGAEYEVTFTKPKP